MSSEETRPTPAPRGRQELLDQVISNYLDEVKAGGEPDNDLYLSKYPELADELRRFFRRVEQARAILPDSTRGRDTASDPASGAILGDESPAPGHLLRDLVRTSAFISRPSSDAGSDSFDHGRFLPGTVLNERYRIVGLLGQGGMGEVYRADDLELGQSVALKFLPERLAGSPKSLERLRNEVRLARQISHANVCRVYDIGHVGELYFLSMEYIDGEDLASLLKRIGRFSHDRGVEVARQLCLGLGAAHSRGVLHRDLKPANVMVDGRGKVRITDFGLASFAGAVPSGELRAGTPAYMAPEQLDGRGVSAQSDLYSLGLVLYELFTGKSAFEAESLAQLIELRRGSTPASPSSVIDDLDPVIERVILRCLEVDPGSRPATALGVAVALPGGDPLAAAVAAGETPSPDLVAASGDVGALQPARAWGLLAAVLIGVALTAFLCGRVQLVGRAPLVLKPEQLELKAAELLEELGYRSGGYSAHGFAYDAEYLRYLGAPSSRDGDASGILFWYRRSSSPLVPRSALDDPGSFVFARGLVTERDPPLEPTMVGLRLDPTGRLVRFLAAAPRFDGDASDGSTGGEAAAPSESAEWSALFESAGLNPDPSTYRQIAPSWTPPVGCDRRRAWALSSDPSEDGRVVEAASLAGHPVFFQVVSPWNLPQVEASGPDVFMNIFAVSYVVLVAFAIVLAFRNWRIGRGDRRGALRLATYFFIASMLAWLLQASHVPSYQELFLLILGLERALFWSAQIWLFYLALEPYVRRLWPQTLVSWSRLLSGRFRDPLIGRDLLIGALAGVSFELLEKLGEFVSSRLSAIPPIPYGPLFGSWGIWLNSLLGERYAMGELMTLQLHAVGESLFFCLLFFLFLRTIARKQWLAVALYIAAHTALLATFKLASGHHVVVFFFSGMGVAIVLSILLRYGLLAVVACHFAMHLFDFPITADISKWYSGSGFVGLAAVVAVAGYGFFTSQVSRPRFAGSAT